jgi:multidrug efflux system membrane fusion protein
MRVRTIENAIVVPAPAVLYGSRGTYVYLVNAEQKATVRDVVVGVTDGNDVSIVKGLEVGELVITEGLDRLREGRNVTAVPDEPAADKKAPKGDRPKGEGKKGGKKKAT